MRRKRLTRTARTVIQRIAHRIARENPAAAQRYYQSAIDTFFTLPDDLTPKRAGERFPDTVRELQVAGFRGYTLRIAVFADRISLVAAFAPGLSDDAKDARTMRGLNEG